jgi:hypothetical protein
MRFQATPDFALDTTGPDGGAITLTADKAGVVEATDHGSIVALQSVGLEPIAEPRKARKGSATAKAEAGTDGGGAETKEG